MTLRYAISLSVLSVALAHGQTQNALDFDGVNDRVACGTDASVDITGTHITVEAWIYPTAWGPNVFSGNIVNKEDAAWSGYMFRAGEVGKLNFAFGDGFAFYEVNSPANALALNTWQHVAATYDGAFQRLYVNGAQVASVARTQTIGTALNPLVLGDWSVNTPGRFFQGTMDEVRIWNITLDAATIAANYGGSYCEIPAGLVAYYKCDQGVAGGDNSAIATLTDAAGPNDGTLSGFALVGNTSNFVGGTLLGTQVSDVICPDASYLFDGQYLTEPGVYTATFQTGGACDSTVVLTLTETTVNTGVVQNTNILIAQASGAGYQWIDCTTDQPIAGATSQYYTAFAVGDYAVIVTQNGCSDTSACYTVTTIGMEEMTAPILRVWPSPVTEHLNVDLGVPVHNATI
ncbi:MAG TPA: LamG domain-containing protein, partial [Flavobacteriales bacterium]|nr:LamG domain-containing protein [Flavobacteriales bacterium]